MVNKKNRQSFFEDCRFLSIVNSTDAATSRSAPKRQMRAPQIAFGPAPAGRIWKGGATERVRDDFLKKSRRERHAVRDDVVEGETLAV